ncbi:hypothetical protein CTEN210_01965 [Chaetoceros tenuissimus]|uniref:Uncharacterized protein n=1 Tax=Chaetoceros tenuissimus TaxID=426638 RepID=A0AAD3CGP3_9STRA|nr:hypothetical protein CTEN210_01965 [Chaetoceros tenuissimus]
MALALENIRALAKDHDYVEIEFRLGKDLLESMSTLRQEQVHTGTGYYRKHITQKWKHRGNDNRDDFLVDSAMRWRYVGRATGLIKNEEDMKSICDICTLHDELYFEENSVPDLLYTRYYKKKFGEFQTVDLNENKFKSYEGIPLEDLDDDLCENGYIFLHDHEAQLMALLTKLVSVENDDIAFELMNWLLGRIHAGQRFADLSANVPKKGRFMSSLWHSVYRIKRSVYSSSESSSIIYQAYIK